MASAGLAGSSADKPSSAIKPKGRPQSHVLAVETMEKFALIPTLDSFFMGWHWTGPFFLF